jgi:hypothetical protein
MFLARTQNRFLMECQLISIGKSLCRSGVTRLTCQATALGVYTHRQLINWARQAKSASSR